MHIRFGVSDDGSQLVVKSMSELHNHEINEVSENPYFCVVFFQRLYCSIVCLTRSTKGAELYMPIDKICDH